MDFFEQQVIARRKSYLLIFLFIFSIIFLVALSNIIVFSFYSYFNNDSIINFYKYWHLKTFLFITIPLVFIILISTFFKLREFSDISKLSLHYFDAKLVKLNNCTSNEKILLNIVSEMSIASGIPILKVYTIEDFGVNSFVIGNDISDASILITSTSLEVLSRDELQSMIAFEFAKVFTGNMQLNMKLVALTYSFLQIFLIGKSLFHGIAYSLGDARQNEEISLIHIILWIFMFIIAIFFLIFGCVGYIVGMFIKFLILKERIYLNDSITIEYTRNPISFIRLLKKSNHYQSYNNFSELFEHSYFIQTNNDLFSKAFNLYPDVLNRIERLSNDGIYDPLIIKDENLEFSNEENHKNKEKKSKKDILINSITGIVILDNFNAIEDYAKKMSLGREILPKELNLFFEDIKSTKALIITLLLSSDILHRNKQLELIEIDEIKDIVIKNYETINLYKNEFNLLIMQQSLLILQDMSINEYRSFRTLLNNIIYLDSIAEVYELNIEIIILRQLDFHFNLRENESEKFFYYEDIKYSFEIFLSVLAYTQDRSDIKAIDSFNSAIKYENISSLELIKKDEISNRLLKLAIKDLSFCSFELRKKILNASIICLSNDNIIENWEIDLIYSISIILKIPFPFSSQKDCNF
jgi:Zn-dependent protease with chaperone function